jgi:NifU-like protein
MNREMFFWDSYSKKLKKRILSPKFAGYFSKKMKLDENIRMVKVTEGDKKQGCLISFYWLVDETNGVIVDARFQIFGPSFLIGAAEVICELVLKKNYVQASNINVDLVETYARDIKENKAFPTQAQAYIILAVSTVSQAVSKCMDISIIEDEKQDAYQGFSQEEYNEYPNWHIKSKKEKLKIIEEILEEHIQPYVELDGGGVKVLDLNNEKEVLISYLGACTHCPASTGSTLNSIQEVLRMHVHRELIVIPEV